MSYPFIGIHGILPEGHEWDAANIEKLLRGGSSIYFEDDEGVPTGKAQFRDGRGVFQFVILEGDEKEEAVVYETASFLEFAVWCAFYGRDFL